MCKRVMLPMILLASFIFDLSLAADWKSEVLPVELQVGYAVRAIDLSGDGKLDIAIVDSKRFLWLENPTWETHVIYENKDAANDNVCFAPLDIDEDGHVDFAVGHDWQPNNSDTGGEIGWLKSPANPRDVWSYHRIDQEPTTHRMQWFDSNQDGRPELTVAPLKGRGTRPPGFDQVPVHLLSFAIPANPVKDPWPRTILNQNLHVMHNFQVIDLDRDGVQELLLASFEGVTWLKTKSDGGSEQFHLGAGHQGKAPALGASEIKLGKLRDDKLFIATIEPWHGDEVVVYQPRSDNKLELWKRSVIDNELKWGHAVSCANLDSDPDDELVIGVRDDQNAAHRSGVRVFDFEDGKWTRTLIEPGQVAVEDLVAADLDSDGDNDIVAVGRATHNAVIYWNR